MNPPDLELDDPVFAEPWQAQAFSMTLKLHEAGAFTWNEWAQTLGAVIAEAGPQDDGSTYYEHWLTALERICEAKGVMSHHERLERINAWDRAARTTPHGQPIELPSQDT